MTGTIDPWQGATSTVDRERATDPVTDAEVVRPQADHNDWLGPKPAAPPVFAGSRKRRAGVSVALLAAGALVGAIGATSYESSSNSSATTGTGPGGQAQGVPGQTGTGTGTGATAGGVTGGAAGGTTGGQTGASGQQVVGTLTAVGPTSITVRSAVGAATYRVTAATRVVLGTSSVALSSLRAGESVVVQLASATTGSSAVAQSVVASTAASGTAGRITPPTGAGLGGGAPAAGAAGQNPAVPKA